MVPPRAHLHDVVRQGKAEEGADDGAAGGYERHRKSQAQAGQVAFEQTGTGGQGSGQGHEQTRAAHKVKVKGEKSADQRYVEYAAANTGKNRDDAKHKTEKQQDGRPGPPGQGLKMCPWLPPAVWLLHPRVRGYCSPKPK